MTYAELQAQILAYVNRPDVEQMVTGFIAMAEAEMQRRLRVRQMVGRSTATLDNEYELLPADFAGVRTFELASNPPVVLEYVEASELSNLATVHSVRGAPIYYSIIGGEVRFAPRPATSYPASQLTYWRKIPALSALNTSNWLLFGHPDAYLYGALKHAGAALGDVRAGGWAAAFDGALKEISAIDPLESGRGA